MTKAWHQHFKRSSRVARTDKDGIVFHSKSEMLRWHTLRMWQLAGHIRNLRRQVKFPLECNGVQVLTEKGNVASYTADFVYEQKLKPSIPGPLKEIWENVIEDFKGYHGREAKFRISVFEALYKVKVKISK